MSGARRGQNMKTINGKPGFYKMKDPNKEAVVNISTKLKQEILRELGITEDDWQDFRIDVILKYVGKEDYVFSSVER